MIDLYTWTTPNGRKISIMLEETGLPYTVHPINIGKREQFAPAFLKISPNNKIPAIVDSETKTSVFESGAILIYLAEKSGKLLPASGAERAKTLEWLMWQMSAVGPMMGQAFHFSIAASEKIPYAIKRFGDETQRLLTVMDTRLGEVPFLAGAYSIADIACFPWVSAYLPALRQQNPDLPRFAQVERWVAAVGDRPAVQKGMRVPQV